MDQAFFIAAGPPQGNKPPWGAAATRQWASVGGCFIAAEPSLLGATATTQWAGMGLSLLHKIHKLLIQNLPPTTIGLKL